MSSRRKPGSMGRRFKREGAKKRRNMDSITWIQEWYASQCDGDWEHQCGVEIGTLDNPGWFLKVNLEETDLEGKLLEIKKIERTKEDWIHVWSDKYVFHGAGGALNLEELLKEFKNFAEG